MLVPITVWFLSAAAIAAPSASCGWDGKPTLEAITFQKRGSETPSDSTQHKRGSRWGRYVSSVEVFNQDATSDDVVLVTLVEVIVAPRILPPELRGKDLTKEVGWGVLADTEYVKSRVIRDLAGCSRTKVQLFDIDLDKMLSDKFTVHEGDLWPWRIRVSASLLAPNSTVLSRAEATLEVVPDDPESTGALLPNSRIIATVRPVTPLACASGAPVRSARYAWR